MTIVDRVPCKCRWKCREYIDLSRGKSPEKPEAYVAKMHNHMLIYIYTYICTHTHPQKGSFFNHFHEKKCRKLWADYKNCPCRLKRPANIEHMLMSMVPPNVDPIWSTSVHLLIYRPVKPSLKVNEVTVILLSAYAIGGRIVRTPPDFFFFLFFF